MVRELIAKGAKIDLQRNDGTSALYVDSLDGHIEVVRELIAKGAKIDLQDNDGETALYIASLYIASQEGHIDMVRLFVENDADIDIQTNNGWSSLMIACECCGDHPTGEGCRRRRTGVWRATRQEQEDGGEGLHYKEGEQDQDTGLMCVSCEN